MTVEAKHACPHYVGRVLRGVKTRKNYCTDVPVRGHSQLPLTHLNLWMDAGSFSPCLRLECNAGAQRFQELEA